MALKEAGDAAELRQLAGQLHRMSAALRATLEQHVQVLPAAVACCLCLLSVGPCTAALR